MDFNIKRMAGKAGTYLAAGLAIAMLGCTNPNREVLVSEAGETFYANRDVADHMMAWAANETYGGKNPRKGVIEFIAEATKGGFLNLLSEADKDKDGKITRRELREVSGFGYVDEKEDANKPLEEIKVGDKVYLAAPNIVDHLLVGAGSRDFGSRKDLKAKIFGEQAITGNILFRLARKADTNGDYVVDANEFSKFDSLMKKEYVKTPNRRDCVMLIPSLRDVVYDEKTGEGYMANVFNANGLDELALISEYGKLPLDKSLKPNQEILLQVCRLAKKGKDLQDKEIGRNEYLGVKRSIINSRQK